jgi:hypothetical protein
MLRRPLRAVALDHEAAEVLLRLEVGAVGDRRQAVAHADGLSARRFGECHAGDELARLTELLEEGLGLAVERLALLGGQRTKRGGLPVDRVPPVLRLL